MVDSLAYLHTLYPFQEEALHVINGVESGFYLTGGTAASRAYLHHRFSDDLDLYMAGIRYKVLHNSFTLWTDRIIQTLTQQPSWQVRVELRDLRFVRLTVIRNGFPLKIEMINDVPAHIGPITVHPQLGRIDSAENILANKITAVVSREEPKDLADIWGFCMQMGLSLTDALENAHGKAAGIFPADIARVLLSATEADWQLIRWIDAPPVVDFLRDLQILGESLIV